MCLGRSGGGHEMQTTTSHSTTASCNTQPSSTTPSTLHPPSSTLSSSSTTTTTTTTLTTSASAPTIHPTFDPSAASESECSEHPADGSGSKTHSERTKRPRKKKTQDRFPKLTVLSANETMVECQLETIKQKTITFKFDITDNDALDVANKLVMTNLLPGNHSEVVTLYINDIMQQLKTNPKVLPVVSTPCLDSRPGQQPSQDSHHRSPSASRRHREDSDARARYLARKLSRSSPKRRRRHSSREEGTGADSTPGTPSKRAEVREVPPQGQTSPVHQPQPQQDTQPSVTPTASIPQPQKPPVTPLVPQAFRTSRFLVSPVAEHKVVPGLEAEDTAAGVAQKQQPQQQPQPPMDTLTPSLVPLPDESPQSSSIPASSTAALLPPAQPPSASTVPPPHQDPQHEAVSISSGIPTSQPGSGGPTPPHHCTPENTYTSDSQARLSQQNSLEKNDSVTSNSNLSDLARKLQQLQTSVGSASAHSMSSVHTAPPLTMPSHPSTPVSLATQPTFSHDLNTQLAGVLSSRASRCSRALWSPSTNYKTCPAFFHVLAPEVGAAPRFLPLGLPEDLAAVSGLVSLSLTPLCLS
ncbi:Serine/threonine-protein kinase WNK1 [Portunus trituberculatus]|uniref:Serine/threonine-protein kinase WNK1 n=1 Tax=Portunus trituberculatus TaxID=210409 RepID=A0A5B7D4G3_PORTR|nr:Serine/threonine-protein kinase WNK1 [Portunus trituberculatus]